MYGDPGVDGYECNEDDSSWHLSAEVDNEDWCEAACGEQQFGRGSCSNTRDWLNDVAEQVARVSEANQVQLAGFERLGGENVARGARATTEVCGTSAGGVRRGSP